MKRRNWIALLLVIFTFTICASSQFVRADEENGEKSSPLPHSAKEVVVPALTTLIVFAILIAVLGKFAWGPIASGLKNREDKIRNDLAGAENARKQAEASLAEYNARLADAENKVRELFAKATKDADAAAASIRMRSQQEAEEIKERATKEIEVAKNQALAEVYEQTANLATAVAEKIIRRNLNADDQRDLVNSSLDQLQSLAR